MCDLQGKGEVCYISTGTEGELFLKFCDVFYGTEYLWRPLLCTQHYSVFTKPVSTPPSPVLNV